MAVPLRPCGRICKSKQEAEQGAAHLIDSLVYRGSSEVSVGVLTPSCSFRQLGEQGGSGALCFLQVEEGDGRVAGSCALQGAGMLGCRGVQMQGCLGAGALGCGAAWVQGCAHVEGQGCSGVGCSGIGMLKCLGAEGDAVPTCAAAASAVWGSWGGCSRCKRSLSHPGLSFCRVFTALRPALLSSWTGLG